MSARARLVLGAGALLAFLGIGAVSVQTSREQLRVIEACEALHAGHFTRAIELTNSRPDSGESGRAAAECRCRALRAAGESAGCEALLLGLAKDPDWVPASDLVDGAIDARAAEEPEAQVIAELAARLPAEGDDAARVRARLAQRHLRRGEPERALDVLGPSPREATGEALALWFDTRLVAHAMGDDLPAAQRTRSAWIAAGTDAAIVRARYALALSIAGLADPEHDTIALLEGSLADTQGVGDPKLREGLAIRLVLSLASAGRLDDALATYDRHQGELGLEGLRRGELLRAARRDALAGVPLAERLGQIRFRLEAPPADAALWLSPPEDAPADTPFEHHAPDGGELLVTRHEGEAPLRWVLRRDSGVVASGTVGPRAGRERLVRIDASGPAQTAPGHVRSRRVADGLRRVVMVLLDCGDWRIVRYLRARGELPVIGALLRDGHRAVLDSDPPLTAAALEALVWPGQRGDASLLGLVHRMGVELAGLASVGDNPFAALWVLLPERDDLFSAIGAGERSAANLLLAHGGIRAGRHGEVSGPHGARGRVPIGRATRSLGSEERLRFPALAEIASERDRHYVRTLAAELDATAELAREGRHALVSVRIEPLDILTHANFADAVADGRDDGTGLLFSVYRYIDARLGAVDAALDEDDVLVVMSDHGIRTAMEHSKDALFVAVGGGIAPGRSPGRPSLRGVPRVLADWLGVRTDWPETGVAPVALAALAASVEAPATP